MPSMRLRRTSFALALAVLPLAVACGASPDATPPPAAPAAPPAPTAVAPPAPSPHAAAPALPAGVEAESVDSSVQPCDDFFHYACGGWIKSHPIPADQSGWGRFHVLNEQNETALKDIVERDQATPSKDEPYSKPLGDYYASCIDEAAVEKDGLRALKPELARIAGVHDPVSLAKVVARLHLINARPFFDIGSEQDFKDATQVIAALDQSGLGLPDRDYYLKDEPKLVALRDKYAAHVQATFVLLGDKPADAKAHADAVMSLEKILAAAQISRVEHRNPENVYHRMDRAALAKTAPTFAWDAYFAELGSPKIDAINAYEPNYLAALDAHLKGATKATWETEIQPYLRWSLARAYSRTLTKAFVDEDFNFGKELSGAKQLMPRWKRCVRAVDHGMGEALAIPFVKEKLGIEGKNLSKQMVQDIESSMQQELQSLAWMDDATRTRALEKVHKLFNKIGYPDKWRNYDALKIDRKSYAANTIRSAEFESKRDLGKIGKPVDRAEWGMTPPTVNAYYNPSMNEMVFPAGILQSPFFAVTRAPAINFGGIGMVMGHELTHGFDDEGRKFDGDGNMKDWWSPDVSKEFDKRASCVSDQFDSYVAVDDLHVNGKLTLGEDIADLGGLKLALASAHAKGLTADENDRQLFFGYAQEWCGQYRPEILQTYTRTDPHAPDVWRVNGPLSNMPEFAKAFSCRAGDTMVRPDDKRCSVW